MRAIGVLGVKRVTEVRLDHVMMQLRCPSCSLSVCSLRLSLYGQGLVNQETITYFKIP
jgi:hypothetical protein